MRLLQDYKRLWRPKFDRYISMELRQRLLHDIDASADWVETPAALASRNWSRDADVRHWQHRPLGW